MVDSHPFNRCIDKKLSWKGLVDFLAERKETTEGKPKDANGSIEQIRELDEDSIISMTESHDQSQK